MITLTKEGMAKLQQCEDQAERDRGGEKWQEFLKAVWETIREQITERMQEMGTYIDQDVKSKLNGVCEMFRVDVGSHLVRSQEKQQELARGIRDVAKAADDRLVENNNRNNHQENC